MIEANTTFKNPYYEESLYAPVKDEIYVDQLTVLEGKVPTDLYGAYVRNGPNPKHEPKGRYHWFDGDGMLHAVYFRDGKVSYRNRYVSTKAFQHESIEGKALWAGLMENKRDNPFFEKEKNTSNTDVVFHNNHLLSLWYRAGQPYKVDALTLKTIGVEDFGGKLNCNVSAHSKVDEHTGEFLFFDYGAVYPYMMYGVASASGELTHCVPIELPGPRLPHDIAITTNFSILMDLPLFNDPEVSKLGRYSVKFFRDLPSRFGIIPRYGGADEIRWFEAEPCYIYHTINAWEEGDEIVLIGCRVKDPCPPSTKEGGPIERMLAFLRLDAHLYYWRFNLKTGTVKEGALCDMNTEFPTINLQYLGQKSRFSYNVHMNSQSTLKFDGLIKYDTWTGQSTPYMFGNGRYGTEASFAPKPDAISEDDGYLVTYVYDEVEDRSELIILDAANFDLGPIARLLIPQKIPMGFHATWVNGEKLFG
ncbi:carotenoid oxygenase family protein [Mesobacillus subterraneus]|uniref:carotenoid oxygenase family protein n=1 Tax=Mesobacillus subterraneus TaxID=285983 RepID=UPI00273E0AE1|nr:carotenoid oxygenase family protein [Mesobacillus subterraneus]WLR57336.1 carotenoid oxygenase family protein [Mesobacillus subterraneus]